MYADAFSFHASEPCHLPFGKLVDGSGQLCAHLFICKLAGQVQGHEFIFQAIVYQVVSAYWLADVLA